MRALVADASVEDRRYVTTVLNACGFDCVRASDGIEALKYASPLGIDLIVTAIDLPILDGVEFLSLVRRGAFGKNPPPAIVCAEQPADAVSLRTAAGAPMAVTAILKPIVAEQLIAAVAASFPEHRTP